MVYDRTCLEERMAAILESLGIAFTEQVSTRSGFVLDFALVDRERGIKIAIETDGSPWHSPPARRRRDAYRDLILRRSGWTVLRFDENFTTEDVAKAIAGAMPDHG